MVGNGTLGCSQTWPFQASLQVSNLGMGHLQVCKQSIFLQEKCPAYIYTGGGRAG